MGYCFDQGELRVVALVGANHPMRAKDILGKRVLRVEQTRVKTNSGLVQNLDRIVFEDGTVLVFSVSETETEYAVYGTVFKKP